MKIKTISYCIISFFIIHFNINFIHGQKIVLIPNPEGKSIDSNPAILYDGKVYAGFYGSGHHYLAGFDGESYSLINNTDTSDQGPFLVSFVFHDSIFCAYSYKLHRNYLAKSDGSSYEVIPNPDTSLYGCSIHYIDFNDKLYFNYLNQDFKFQLAWYQNNSISLIANPDTGVGIILSGDIYHDQLYFKYRDVDIKDHLARFEEDTLRVYPNPDSGEGCRGSRIFYNDRMYIVYYREDGKRQLAVLENDSVRLMDELGFKPRQIVNTYIVYKGDLYLFYQESIEDSKGKLARFDGSTLERIPNPTGSAFGFNNAQPMLFRDMLYLQYYSSGTRHELLKYDGETFTFVNNPYNDCYLLSDPVIFGDSLYYRYRDTTKTDFLAICDGNSLQKVENPDTGCIDPVHGCGYFGLPIINNGTLYLRYKNNEGTLQLAKYEKPEIKELPEISPLSDPELNYNGQETEISVYDLSGRIILRNKQTRNQIQTELNSLRSGLYLVRISDGRKVKVEKIIVF